MPDYVITIRTKDPNTGLYTDEPGLTQFLQVPDGALDYAGATPLSPGVWVDQVLGLAPVSRDATGVSRRDVLVFIHGFNDSISLILQRHRMIRNGLAGQSFGGMVVSFDWPCDDTALAYVADRSRAKVTADHLVSDCIKDILAQGQVQPDCNTNVHLLAHSTGAYVVRQAFNDADDRNDLPTPAWMVSQIAFIAGDISSGSMSAGNTDGEAIYHHCVRMTNYSNPYDEVLQISNVKRVGVAPRVGRVALPPDAPSTAVNVDCGDYYESLPRSSPVTPAGVTQSHSWYFGDPVFTADLAQTLNGNVDRGAITTRKLVSPNRYTLVKP
jgi:pimeloyl-ACP methyl ester carboxylesterase